MSFANTVIIKYAKEIKIDCKILNIKNGRICFLKTAAIIIHTKPAIPTVKYDKAEINFSIP